MQGVGSPVSHNAEVLQKKINIVFKIGHVMGIPD